MPFDGLTISHLVKELNDQLSGQRIDKIYQPQKDELTLVIRQKKGSSRLLISINPRWGRMYLSQERRENPLQPTAFCMLLRKHLEGAKILELAQQGFDRIVWIKVEALNDLMEWQEKILICEFTGRNANVVLVDPQKNVILDGMKRYGHELSSHREVQPGIEYVAPPSQNKLNPMDCDYKAFYESLWNNNPTTTIAMTLFRTFTGLSPATCSELCLLVGVEPDSPVGECGEYEFVKLHNIICRSLPSKEPTVLMGANGPQDYYVFKPASRNSYDFDTHDSINEAMDHFYTLRLKQLQFVSLRSNISRNVNTLLEKAYKKLFFQEGDLSRAQKSEILRISGELLTTYGYQITRGQTKVRLPNFDGQGETEIELAPHLTPHENAQRYFKQYAKAKNARRKLGKLISNSREDIRYLESVKLALNKATTIEEVEDITDELEEQGFAKAKSRGQGRKKGPTRSVPHHFMSTDGLSIWVGKNNRQNDVLTFKNSRRTDLWLHTQDYAGAHVILELSPSIESIEDVSTNSLEEAAILAAYFSQSKEADKVAVDYTFRSNVKKPRGARPGMVIYERYRTIYVSPSDQRLPALLETYSS